MVYLAFMMAATRDGVAMLLRSKSAGRFARVMSSLFFTGIDGHVVLYHFPDSRGVFHPAEHLIGEPLPSAFPVNLSQLLLSQLVLFLRTGS